MLFNNFNELTYIIFFNNNFINNFYINLFNTTVWSFFNLLSVSWLFYYSIILNLIEFLFINDAGIYLNTYKSNYYVYVTILQNYSLNYSIKFTVSILFLIFIRAGIPRYRYDFLTKLGWIKFFLYTLIFFFFNYCIFLLI